MSALELHNPIGSEVADEDTRTTPRWLFNVFNEVYGFGLDAAASSSNALCSRFLTQEQDALKQDWAKESWERPVWCNPPFSRLAEFAEKAVATAFNSEASVPVVMVMPANRWEQPWCQATVLTYASALVFPRGRVSFGGTGKSPEWPTVVVVFDIDARTPPRATTLAEWAAMHKLPSLVG